MTHSLCILGKLEKIRKIYTPATIRKPFTPLFDIKVYSQLKTFINYYLNMYFSPLYELFYKQTMEYHSYMTQFKFIIIEFSVILAFSYVRQNSNS